MEILKVTFANGDAITTPINGTREEIAKYYYGHYFNIGSVTDNVQKAVKVEFLDNSR